MKDPSSTPEYPGATARRYSDSTRSIDLSLDQVQGNHNGFGLVKANQMKRQCRIKRWNHSVATSLETRCLPP